MSSGLDFRSTVDNAWYTVGKLIIDEENHTLVVRFSDIANKDEKEVFKVEEFETADELKRFSQRFRPACIQLQDDQCRRVGPGSQVCAVLKRKKDEKFYNGVIYFVDHVPHKQDDCLCEFGVLWTDGPMISSWDTMGIERVCRRKKGCPLFDPALRRFVEMSEAHVKSAK